LNKNYQFPIIFDVNIPDNLPLNGRSVFHLSQYLLLHYLRKENQAKYASKHAKKREKNIPNIIERNSRHGYQTSIIFAIDTEFNDLG